MIAFTDWVSQIVGYGTLVVDDAKLLRAWTLHDHSQTSVTGFDELYEQIFDDLDSERFQNELAIRLANDREKCAAINGFLQSIKHVDQQMKTNPILCRPDILLASSEWGAVRVAAKKLIGVYQKNAGA